jgi:pyruvate dehydrogenase E2 component (dihydrolipoamide acetyltransferase)
MTEIVPMPNLGFETREGKLIRMVVLEGQPIHKGQVLAEVEADKATVEVESPINGHVITWLVQEGQTVAVGKDLVVIAPLGETAEPLVDQASLVSLQQKQVPVAPAPSTLVSRPATMMQFESNYTVAPIGETQETLPRMSPVARRMAEELGIDPRQIKGTGPHGRILKQDLQNLGQVIPAQPNIPTPNLPVPTPGNDEIVVPLSKLRATIGHRMAQSKAMMPHLYVTNTIDMGPAIELRRQLNELLDEDNTLSLNDLIMRATALTLHEFPNLNASLRGDAIIHHTRVHLGMAVAVPNGLLTVVIRDCDTKSLKEIASATQQLAKRARAGKIKPEDVGGSTFTISNLGMFNIESFAAIINPPESAILGVSTAKQVPVVINGSLAVGWRMLVTLSADHRVTDGVEVAQFLQALRQKLEKPLELVL